MAKTSFSNEEVNTINKEVAEVIRDLLDYFGVDYKEYGGRLTGCCPIHGGDNKHAWNVYPDSDTYPPNWKCYTNHCQQTYGKSLIGLVRGLLYQKEGQKYTFYKTVKFIEKFLGKGLDKLELEYLDKEKEKYIQQARLLYQDEKLSPILLARDEVKKYLLIPARQYLDRGYSPEILKKFDVGYCANKGRQLSHRIIFPIYESGHKYCVGASGRTIFPLCSKCKLYHYGGDCKYGVSKWRHSAGFKKDLYLYNFWFAKGPIKKTNVAIITESPGNCLRAVQAGITNIVGVMGAALTNQQKRILDGSSAFKLVVVGDSDAGGQQLWESVERQCAREYKLERLVPPKNDLGDCSVEEVRELLKDYLPETK